MTSLSLLPLFPFPINNVHERVHRHFSTNFHHFWYHHLHLATASQAGCGQQGFRCTWIKTYVRGDTDVGLTSLS